ncbi:MULTISPECIES: hypothetical protein [Rhodococcus erythropolis group]|uniref:Uncharacterized protein n=1 Tax=Rhodococcus erythropolis TaxID=1833 RepID=A0A8I0ZWS6_RHOER|nr:MULTISPECIES: hypothetical protein [Rhodococcus erythropolis group]MBH5144247.1 hypothetical protein [Rhodococcus erythropolis]MDJ0434703.1 hypothetical protein [Rhodococcus qingshengii]QEM25717.1 hypothetical protein D6M20_02425 [Rhodococcus qingshengii]
MSALAWLVWGVVLLSIIGMICGGAVFAIERYRNGEGDGRALKAALVCGVVAMVIPALFTGPHSTLPYAP